MIHDIMKASYDCLFEVWPVLLIGAWAWWTVWREEKQKRHRREIGWEVNYEVAQANAKARVAAKVAAR